jgi:hypothetical protein
MANAKSSRRLLSFETRSERQAAGGAREGVEDGAETAVAPMMQAVSVYATVCGAASAGAGGVMRTVWLAQAAQGAGEDASPPASANVSGCVWRTGSSAKSAAKTSSNTIFMRGTFDFKAYIRSCSSRTKFRLE